MKQNSTLTQSALQGQSKEIQGNSGINKNQKQKEELYKKVVRESRTLAVQ